MAKGRTAAQLSGIYKAMPLGSVLARMANHLPVEALIRKRPFVTENEMEEIRDGYRTAILFRKGKAFVKRISELKGKSKSWWEGAINDMKRGDRA